ncbi:hypothetical protein D3C84_1210310 [compost metagenome]
MIVDASAEEAGVTLEIRVAPRQLAHISEQTLLAERLPHLKFTLKPHLLRDIPKHLFHPGDANRVQHFLLILFRNW